jgi:hypothetical protein
MTAVVNTNSVAMVGVVDSCFVHVSRCFLLSAHILPLMDLSCFSFKNINEETALLLSTLDKLPLCMGWNTSMSLLANANTTKP